VPRPRKLWKGNRNEIIGKRWCLLLVADALPNVCIASDWARDHERNAVVLMLKVQ